MDRVETIHMSQNEKECVGTSKLHREISQKSMPIA